jgi:uroporphyrinogen decarboxylase
MNEWGEYRIFDDTLDYHHKIAPFGQKTCTVGDIEAYPFPNLTTSYRYEGLEETVQTLHDQDLAAVLSWEMTIFEKAWRIRGLEEMLIDFVMNPEVVECLLDRVAEQTGYLAARYAEAGVDVIQLGDDVGSQNGMMISPRVWRKFLKPRLAELIAGIKAANPEVLVFYHTDGVVDPVIPDFIEIGIDVLNPVQPECMDIGKLKILYGDQLSFWGGIGVQSTLPFGTPAEVRKAVHDIIMKAGQNGGLLVAPAHVIEPDVPWENVEAFVQAMRDFGTY